jgi:hypothetical protein
MLTLFVFNVNIGVLHPMLQLDSRMRGNDKSVFADALRLSRCIFLNAGSYNPISL